MKVLANNLRITFLQTHFVRTDMEVWQESHSDGLDGIMQSPLEKNLPLMNMMKRDSLAMA